MSKRKQVRINPLSKEAKEIVETHGNIMMLLETKKKGPFSDWNDNVLLTTTLGIPYQFWFRNGIVTSVKSASV